MPLLEDIKFLLPLVLGLQQARDGCSPVFGRVCTDLMLLRRYFVDLWASAWRLGEFNNWSMSQLSLGALTLVYLQLDHLTQTTPQTITPNKLYTQHQVFSTKIYLPKGRFSGSNSTHPKPDNYHNNCPDTASCNMSSKIGHFAKDCPQLKREKHLKSVTQQ